MHYAESTTGTIPPNYEPASDIARRLAYDTEGPSIQSPQPASSSVDATSTPNVVNVPVADYSVVSEQPLVSPAMSFNGLPPPSVTTFANVRGPNLSKLTEGMSHIYCPATYIYILGFVTVFYRLCESYPSARLYLFDELIYI